MIFLIIISFYSCLSRQNIRTIIEIPSTPLSSDNYFIQGWKELERNDFRKAEIYFEKIPPDSPLYLTAQGFLNLKQNQLQTARNLFEKALTEDPFLPQALLGKAMVEELQGKFQEAFNLYNRLLLIQPENYWLQSRKQKIKETQSIRIKSELDLAEPHSQKYLKLLQEYLVYNPDDLNAQQKISETYLSLKNFEEALKSLIVLHQAYPQDTSIIKKIVSIYIDKEELENALLYAIKFETASAKSDEAAALKESIIEKLKLSKIPLKIKQIIFKDQINRSELAGIIYYYFSDYLKMTTTPEILTDITSSEYQKECVILASLKIMPARADHSFDIYGIPNRNSLVIFLKNLFEYLASQQIKIKLDINETIPEPLDIPPEHNLFELIKLLVKANILTLKENNTFQPSANLNGLEVLIALKTIKKSIN